MADEFESVRLQAAHGPDVHFEGKLLGEYTTQRKDGGKSRWTELRLWETRAGNWIAESVGCSDVGRERDIRDVRVISESANRQHYAMEAWGWTTAAKAFARELGWDVVHKVP